MLATWLRSCVMHLCSGRAKIPLDPVLGKMAPILRQEWSRKFGARSLADWQDGDSYQLLKYGGVRLPFQ